MQTQTGSKWKLVRQVIVMCVVYSKSDNQKQHNGKAGYLLFGTYRYAYEEKGIVVLKKQLPDSPIHW